MPKVQETIEVARRVLPIIYVLDTSKSMSGERIKAVNDSMAETLNMLRDAAKDNPDADLKVGVLTFSSGAQWATNGLVYLDDFFWNPLKADGVTDLGAALDELDTKLSRKAYLNSETGLCVPVLIFMSDGQPTDNYAKALDNIKQNNKWFQCATKVCIALGKNADYAVLAKVAGNKEAVIGIDGIDMLKAFIRAVSVSASRVGSVSRTSADGDAVSDILKQTKADLGDDADQLDLFSDDPTSDVWNDYTDWT